LNKFLRSDASEIHADRPDDSGTFSRSKGWFDENGEWPFRGCDRRQCNVKGGANEAKEAAKDAIHRAAAAANKEL